MLSCTLKQSPKVNTEALMRKDDHLHPFPPGADQSMRNRIHP